MKKCPKCGSYDTRPAYENYVGRGVVNVGRAALTIGGGIIRRNDSPYSRTQGCRVYLEKH